MTSSPLHPVSYYPLLAPDEPVSGDAAVGWTSARAAQRVTVVDLPGYPRCRDLGGLTRRDGSRTAPGRVLRAATPAALTTTQRAAVDRVGLSSVLDLRSAQEVQASPHPLRGRQGYRHLPLVDPRAEVLRDPEAEPTPAAVYCGSLGRNTATLGAIFAAIAVTGDDARAGPVLVSCAAGRDRTGMVAAMLLDLAGVERAAVVADYRRADPAGTRSSDIEALLDHLREHHGSTAGYLRSLGLGTEQLCRLEELLRPR